MGSYCFWIDHCLAYTEYGRCTSCSDGYYLSEKGSCDVCGAKYTKKYTDAYNTESEYGRCVKCNGPDSCYFC